MELRKMPFQDITITSVDKNKTYRPDPEKLLYNVCFGLSANPPTEWVQIFEIERRFPRHTMWRRAWVDSRCIVVTCALDEVKMHLKDIKQDVENTNKKYREYLKQRETERQGERERAEAERREIDEALDELSFG